MATQIKTKIEELSPEFRENLEQKNNYFNEDSYDKSEKATTTKGWGKGDPESKGLIHVKPSTDAVPYAKATISRQISADDKDDKKIGGKYDRGPKGYNDIDGGRAYLKGISLYNSNNEYPHSSIDAGSSVRINYENSTWLHKK